jgi:hypothetical protein
VLVKLLTVTAVTSGTAASEASETPEKGTLAILKRDKNCAPELSAFKFVIKASTGLAVLVPTPGHKGF